LLVSSSVLSRGEERAFLRGEESGSERASRERERERQRQKREAEEEEKEKERENFFSTNEKNASTLSLFSFFYNFFSC